MPYITRHSPAGECAPHPTPPPRPPRTLARVRPPASLVTLSRGDSCLRDGVLHDSCPRPPRLMSLSQGDSPLLYGGGRGPCAYVRYIQYACICIHTVCNMV